MEAGVLEGWTLSLRARETGQEAAGAEQLAEKAETGCGAREAGVWSDWAQRRGAQQAMGLAEEAAAGRMTRTRQAPARGQAARERHSQAVVAGAARGAACAQAEVGGPHARGNRSGIQNG